ncbi:hypothetical protein [Speluncibacter jeojiensis]|nr:hypothetical protein [Rhodococcus sp. D2-41]
MNVIDTIAEHAVWITGRIACRLLHRHNVTCRGRADHYRLVARS